MGPWPRIFNKHTMVAELFVGCFSMGVWFQLCVLVFSVCVLLVLIGLFCFWVFYRICRFGGECTPVWGPGPANMVPNDCFGGFSLCFLVLIGSDWFSGPGPARNAFYGLRRPRILCLYQYRMLLDDVSLNRSSVGPPVICLYHNCTPQATFIMVV